MLADVVGRAVALDSTIDEAQVTVAMIRLDEIWGQLFPAEQQRIARLVPDIVAAILDETLPPDLTLFELAVDPPPLWDEQRKRIGMPL
jgi:hypothetical protein